MAKAASAAFFFGMIACGEPLQAQQANENERDMIGAAERGEIVVVRKLLANGARIDARDQRGRTALLAATQRNRIEIARFLIQEGSDVNAKDFIQDSPYLYAAAEGRIEILKAGPHCWKRWILGDGGAVHTEIVRLLVEAGANVNIADRDGVTPLAHARKSGYSGMVRILSAAGAR
jgi:ankyrin repeat protein